MYAIQGDRTMSILILGRRPKLKIILILLILILCWMIWTRRQEVIGEKYHRVREDKFVLVSAYYSIGKFMKPENKPRTPNDYYKWMKKFRFLNNHLVFFSDSRETLNYMALVRGNKSSTLIFLDRHELIGFKNIERIKRIFQLPGFGLHPEETGNYNYSAIMHSKHDMIRRAINLFSNQSPIFAWIDIGLFRFTRPVENFELKGSGFIDKTRVMLSQSFVFHDLPIEYIIKNARTWVSGAIMVGHADAMLNFCDVYGEFFIRLLSMELMATDEQVIYALYSSEGRSILEHSAKISVFQCDYFGLYLLFTKVPSFDKCPT